MIKEFTRALLDTAKANTYAYCCPSCAILTKSPTVSTRMKWDKRSHSFKYYMSCSKCNYVTPLLSSTIEVFDIYDDNWISYETKAFSSIL